MTMESNVADVLRKAPVGTISFKIDTVAVNKDQMEAVAKAIESKDIAVEVASTGPQLGAAYSSFVSRTKWGAGEKKIIGRITLGKADLATSAIGKSSIFHECVHALIDVKGLKVSMHEDEIVAYLADAMYLKKTATGISGGKTEMAIYNAAFGIIAQHKMLTKLGVALKWSDCDALRDAIKAHPAYQ
jgi:hypothetical protein